MTGLVGLPVYLDLIKSDGFAGAYRETFSSKATELDGCTDSIVLYVYEHIRRRLRGGYKQGREGREILQDFTSGGAAWDEAFGTAGGRVHSHYSLLRYCEQEENDSQAYGKPPSQKVGGGLRAMKRLDTPLASDISSDVFFTHFANHLEQGYKSYQMETA
jgi:hypothetical protein